MRALAIAMVLSIPGCAGEASESGCFGRESSPDCVDEEADNDEGRASEPTTIADESALCLRSRPDGSLAVRAIGTRCLSSSCTQVLGTSCTFEYDEQAINVHTSLVVKFAGGGAVCTTDCMRLPPAECAPIFASPGPYAVRLGAAVETVDLPTEPLGIFDEGNFGNNWCE